MPYNPVLEHLGAEITHYPPGIQCLLTQMGERMEQIRLMILDYNAWAENEPETPDCISLLRGMPTQPGTDVDRLDDYSLLTVGIPMPGYE